MNSIGVYFQSGLFTNVGKLSTKVALNDPLAFRNNREGAALVDSISFDYSLHQSTAAKFPTAKARISIGRLQLTEGFVPVLGLGPREVGSAAYNARTVAWKFPRPLFFPRGQQFNIAIDMETNAGAGVAQEVFVTLKGRLLDPDTATPALLDVPWTSPPSPIGKTTTEFVNPLSVPLSIARVISSADSTTLLGSTTPVTISTSSDRFILKTPTQARYLTGPRYGTIPLSLVLKPGEALFMDGPGGWVMQGWRQARREEI